MCPSLRSARLRARPFPPFAVEPEAQNLPNQLADNDQAPPTDQHSTCGLLSVIFPRILRSDMLHLCPRTLALAGEEVCLHKSINA